MENLKNRNTIVFYLNGQRIEVTGADTLKPFAHYLRYFLDKPGTKIVCSEGDCGACTIMVANFRSGSLQKFQAINSCIAPVFSLDLSHVVTVEGLADEQGLSVVQKAFVANNGAQCGYCTPGFVCAMTALAEDCIIENKPITAKKARNYLTGNLCRCTGYEPILKAATSIDLKEVKSLTRYVSKESLADFVSLSNSVEISGSNFKINMPTTLAEAAEIKSADTRIIAGATDLGVLINKDKFSLVKVLNLVHISELQKVQFVDGKCKVGARVTLTQLEESLKMHSPEFAEILKIFASPQIKNNATLVGNVVNASPIADTIPALMILNTVIVTLSKMGSRRIAITDFYKGYKQLDLLPEEIVTHVEFQIPRADQIFKLFKASPRKDLDISVVTFAGLFSLDQKMITDTRIAFGGVGPVVIRMHELEKKFIGRQFTQELFTTLSHFVEKEISPLSDLRGSREYRLKLGENLVKKCYTEISTEYGL